MGFSFRKSVKVGPIKVNGSKSGLGVSSGVKGVRFGVNAKGQSYTSIGRKGVYYRSTSKKGKQSKIAENEFEQMAEPVSPTVIGIGSAIGLLIFSWFVGFFSPTLKIVGIVLGVVILILSILAGIANLRKSGDTTTEEVDSDDYADTIRTQIVQNEALSSDEIDDLISEYCERKGLSADELSQIKTTLLYERNSYQKTKGDSE